MASGSDNNNMPIDLQIMMNILKQGGVVNYDLSVLNQMLEFTYRYVTNILEDALLFSSYAKKNSIDCEDVKLAIGFHQDKTFACVPPRELTAELARCKNSVPLPAIRSSPGLHMPSDKYSITAPNYTLKHQQKKARTDAALRSDISNSMPVPNKRNIIQKPNIKFSEGIKAPMSSQVSTISTVPMLGQASIQNMQNSVANNQLIMPNVIEIKSEKSTNGDNKRVHEDDDYDT